MAIYRSDFTGLVHFNNSLTAEVGDSFALSKTYVSPTYINGKFSSAVGSTTYSYIKYFPLTTSTQVWSFATNSTTKTISLWFYISSSAATSGTIFAMDTDTSGNPGYYGSTALIYSSSDVSLVYNYSNYPTGTNITVGTKSVTLDTWHYAKIVRDSVTASNSFDLKYYIDGYLIKYKNSVYAGSAPGYYYNTCAIVPATSNVYVDELAAYTTSDTSSTVPTEPYTSVQPYTITASAGTGGSISPNGSVSVTSGSSQTFTITPSTGYSISDVLVDSVSQGAISTYTFSSVTAAHTISASFTQITYAITSTAGTGGTISPSGSTTVAYSNSQTFTITPNSNYNISDVLVDGTSVGAVSTYTFSNVTAAHTISATFELAIVPVVISNISYNSLYSVTVTWTDNNADRVSNNVYVNGTLATNTTSTSYTFTITELSTATIYIVSVGSSGEISGTTSATSTISYAAGIIDYLYLLRDRLTVINTCSCNAQDICTCYGYAAGCTSQCTSDTYTCTCVSVCSSQSTCANCTSNTYTCSCQSNCSCNTNSSYSCSSESYCGCYGVECPSNSGCSGEYITCTSDSNSHGYGCECEGVTSGSQTCSCNTDCTCNYVCSCDTQCSSRSMCAAECTSNTTTCTCNTVCTSRSVCTCDGYNAGCTNECYCNINK